MLCFQGFCAPSHDDKLMEVVGITGITHMVSYLCNTPLVYCDMRCSISVVYCDMWCSISVVYCDIRCSISVIYCALQKLVTDVTTHTHTHTHIHRPLPGCWAFRTSVSLSVVTPSSPSLVQRSSQCRWMERHGYRNQGLL